MPDLLLHGREVKTVFDLLGQKENDLTYALGWALANSDELVQALLTDVGAEMGQPTPGAIEGVLLQEHLPGTGFTDIEIRTEAIHLILEAKRGWEIPDSEQLGKYAGHLLPGKAGVLLIVAEGSRSFAAGRYEETFPGPEGPVPALYRSWEDLLLLTESSCAATNKRGEVRLLRELVRYFRGLIHMQNVRDNLVYVVALGDGDVDWSPMSPRRIVEELNAYFHPVGGGRGGWPKEPPNYIGFRFDGQLQAIRHVDDVEVFTKPGTVLPEFGADYDFGDPHYLYRLGPAIRPTQTVRSGQVKRALRVWAAIDLLLTSDTISDARDRTRERLDAAGEL